MKTAISIPDPIFRSAEQAARRMKVSRSQLYAAAVAAYLDRHDSSAVTEKLNQVHSDAGASSIEPAFTAAQIRCISRERR